MLSIPYLIMLGLGVLMLTCLVPLSQCYQPNCTVFEGRDDKEHFEFDWNPLTSRKLPDACEDAGENPRGKYSANLSPCTFRFHNISEDESNLSRFRLTTVCSEDNLVGGKEGFELNTVKDYVKNWPDDCVADFQRCYSVARDEKIFLKFVCSKGWLFPEGTTHISVSCVTDKARKLEEVEEDSLRFRPDPEEDPIFVANEKRIHDIKMAVLFLFAACLLAGTVFFCVSYRLVIRPYFQILHCQLKGSEDDDKDD